jgi:hypothetical protein
MYTLANNLEDARLFICITWVGRLLTGFLLHQINSITAEKTSATNGRGSTFLMSPIGAQKAIFFGKSWRTTLCRAAQCVCSYVPHPV